MARVCEICGAEYDASHYCKVRRGKTIHLTMIGPSIGGNVPKDTDIARSKDAGDICAAAMSVARLVDEWCERGWNGEGRAHFAKLVERRLRRYWPSYVEEAVHIGTDFSGKDDE